MIREKLNDYINKIGTLIQLALSPFNALLVFILIFGSVIGIAINEDQNLSVLVHIFVLFFYLSLVINSVFYALNAFAVRNSFLSEVDKYEARGILLTGIEGFGEAMSDMNNFFATSVGVSVTTLVSFIIYFSQIVIDPQAGTISFRGREGNSLMLLGSGLLIIAAAITLIARPPRKPAFKPGGLMGFYQPKSLPLKLDNMFADGLKPFLDPPTKLKFDDFNIEIVNNLHPEFNPNMDPQTRMEIAREKILMLIYLSQKMPEVFDDNLLDKELGEILKEKYKEKFMSTGGNSNISKQVLYDIIKQAKKQIPEIFTIFERLLIQLTDNLQEFKTKDLYLSIVHPTVHSGTRIPFKILVFLCNKDKSFASNRKIKVKVETGINSLDPESFEYTLQLDPMTKEALIEDDKLKFIAEGDNDAITTVSEYLQIGDSILLQFKPNRLGVQVINISLEDPEQGIIAGETVYVNVRRDLNYYIKTYGAKIGTYAGAAISAIGLSYGSIMSLLENFLP